MSASFLLLLLPLLLLFPLLLFLSVFPTSFLLLALLLFLLLLDLFLPTHRKFPLMAQNWFLSLHLLPLNFEFSTFKSHRVHLLDSLYAVWVASLNLWLGPNLHL